MFIAFIAILLILFLILFTSCLAQTFAIQVSVMKGISQLPNFPLSFITQYQDREVFNEDPLYDSSLFVENEVKIKIDHFTKERKMSNVKSSKSYSERDVWKK